MNEVSASLRDDERFPPARDAKVILCDVSKMALLSHIPYYCLSRRLVKGYATNSLYREPKCDRDLA